jgi:hypothetical protein
MTKGSNTSGGVAEATGSNYENLVAAWYCVRILLGSAAHPDFDLPHITRVIELSLQSAAAVDDINLVTSDDGRIFVQAKRSVTLSRTADSPLGSAIDQFVRQLSSGVSLDPKGASFRALDRTRDRLVLATRGARAAKITNVLPRLLRRLRDRAGVETISHVVSSAEEREVAEVIEAQIRASWATHLGVTPSDADVGQLLRYLWVQTLDVEEGEADRRSALDLMRANLLAGPSQAELAFSLLVARCGRLRAERSGADAGGLLTSLSTSGIALVALPDFRADVEALRNWTRMQLRGAHRFNRLLSGRPASTITRTAWPVIQAAAVADSLLIVGEPGAGKSGMTYRLAEDAAGRGGDVVFLPVDLLAVSSLAALRAELGISHDLAVVLGHWPGQQRGLLVVDALDAARSLQAQTIVRAVIDDVLQVADRWAVVASVRSYDLRYGTEWRAMFRGPPVAADHRDPEFAGVRHLAVQRLTDEEVEQTTAFLPALHQLFVDANSDLRQLLRNIFNLHLLAELVEQGVISTDLAIIRTQSELLDTYWSHRVRRNDGKHDGREQALREIVQRMIQARTLKIFRADVVDQVDSAALVDLEQHDILRAEEEARGPNDDVLLFTHHVLFDYAVARLLFRRGRDPAAFVDLLRSDRTLAVMAAPSLTMALADLWSSDPTRRPFWDLALAVAAEDDLPATAHLAAPMTAVEFAREIADMAPLISALEPANPRRLVAEGVLRNVIGAINVRRTAGVSPIGPDSGPWMDLARALAELGTEGVVSSLRVLLAIGTENADGLTPEQLGAAGEASRRLLDYALGRQ